MTITSPTRDALRPLRGSPSSPPSTPRNWPVFAVAAGIGMVLAYVVDHVLGITHGDSLSRTVNALLALFSRDPHLAAVGFVWPPLPTWLRMPLLLVARPLGYSELTGPVISTLFGAGVVMLLNVMLRNLGFAGRTRLVWIAAAMLNPLVLLEFVNGTAESAYTFFMLLVLVWVLKRREAPTASLVIMGLAAAMAFLVRYEAVALVATVAIALSLIDLIETRSAPRATAERVFARLVVFGAPVAFVAAAWLAANWAFVGDPLFFFRGRYSLLNAPEVARNAPQHVLQYAYGSLLGTVLFVARTSVMLSIAYVLGLLVCAWRGAVRRDPDSLALFVICASIPAMLAEQAFTGSIPPFLRYWMYLPVLAVPLCALALREEVGARVSPRLSRGVRVGRVLVPVLFAAGAVTTAFAMTSNDVGYDERVFALQVLGRAEEASALTAAARAGGGLPDEDLANAVAADLDGRAGLRMLDLEQSGAIVLRMRRLERLVVNTDKDFGLLLSEPSRSGIQWILLQDPVGRSTASLNRDAVYSLYPGLYEGADWLRLEREFKGTPGWRLYEVVIP